MKKSELKQIIKEEILKIVETEDQDLLNKVLRMPESKLKGLRIAGTLNGNKGRFTNFERKSSGLYSIFRYDEKTPSGMGRVSDEEINQYRKNIKFHSILD